MVVTMIRTRFKNLFLALGLAAALTAPLVATPADAADKPLTVVELFTSQGCSSCPAADRFLGELAKRDDLVALSLHVDYWDYIGWKDPFASADITRRQRDYAKMLGLRYVYTPQMVIQGADHATGSDRSSVLQKIAEARALPRVPVNARFVGEKLEVTVGDRARAERATVWLAMYDRQHETPVRRGENGGRTLKNYNVVRSMTRIGTWSGQPLVIPATVGESGGRHPDGCAVILQSIKTGRILGAARIDMPKD
jgi:hypothetical protein